MKLKPGDTLAGRPIVAVDPAEYGGPVAIVGRCGQNYGANDAKRHVSFVQGYYTTPFHERIATRYWDAEDWYGICEQLIATGALE